jgi:hypothetical protein
MLRRIAIIIGFFAFAGLVVPDLSPLTPVTAEAQQTQQKRKNLLELLFGGGLRKQQEKQQKRKEAKQAKRIKLQQQQSTAKRSTKKQTGKKAAVAAAPVKPAVEKAENAAKVLVIGDFMGTQLGQGLTRQFAANPGIMIVDGTVALSGMVRDDVKNWPADIAGLVEETRPIAVVALVGMNDRQLIRNSQGKLKKLTEPWIAEYERRADALARNIREKRVPMIWVGLPPVSKGRMNADYLKFNEIYRQTVEAYGGAYVDVWDGFVDTEGRYVRAGPDVNGQIVALRRSDGINMTQPGYDKLAFFAEKAVKRITGFGRDSLVSSLSGLAELPGATQPQYDPIGTGKTIVIALGSPSADGGTALEGAEGFLKASDASASSAFELVVRGVAVQPKSGRVDAGWGKPSFDLGREETPEPVLANIRGYSLKSLLDELPPLVTAPEDSTDSGAEPTVSN